MEPLPQNVLDPPLGSPQADFGIILSGEEVQSGDNVCLTIPPTVKAVKPVPVTVVLVDVAARRNGTGLTGVGSVDRLKAGTSRLCPYLQSVAQPGSGPLGHDPRKLPTLRPSAKMG